MKRLSKLLIHKGKKPAIFVGATNQNEGKTTVCLGILSGLLKRYRRVGFIKPVGQEHVKVADSLFADKDVFLFKKCFGLKAPYELMSPILFTRGFTRECVDGKMPPSLLKNKIRDAYTVLEHTHDCMLIEGTGNLGVGSIAGIDNVEVAKMLGVDMILIASGGIGSSFDLIALNKALCDQKGVRIRGVILNKILDDKRGNVLHYMQKALDRWDIPILGAIPYDPLLTTPSMRDFETLFQTKLLSGTKQKLRHFEKMRLVATSLDTYEKLIVPNQLIITPATREDIILATLKAHWDFKINDPDSDLESGIIFTGSTAPSTHIIKQIRKADIPMLYSAQSSFTAMKMISNFTAKIQIEDKEKVREAIQVTEDHINFKRLFSILEGK